MGTSRSAAQFVGKINAATKAVQKARQDILREAEQEMKAGAVKAVAADLSVTGTPEGFSGWRPTGVVPLEVRGKNQGDDSVLIQPSPQSRGPWRVAQDGRRGGGAFDLIQVGRVRKNGTRRGRSRGRNQGGTGGKGTWDDAVELGTAKLPKKVRSEIASAMKGAFK